MRFLCAALTATFAATGLGAQRAPSDANGRTVQVGDRARIRAVQRDTTGRRIDCEARVTAIAGDTVVIENASRWGACPRRLYEPETLARAEFAYRDRGSRLAHTAFGLAAGALAGGGFARLLAGNGCRAGFSGCDDGDFAVAVITFLGVVAGGTVGGIIGVALPAGAQWRPLPTTAPVRVAGLALRPSIQVGIR